jgi:hypothetical protein
MGRKPYESFTCSCGERCIMVPHETSGKLAPITTTAYAGGTIAIALRSVNGGHGRYRIVPKAEREADPRPRPMNHFSNCPDRAHCGGRP